MSVVWRPKKKLNVFEATFSNVIWARLDGATLKVYSFDGPMKMKYVAWSVHRPNHTLDAGGRDLYCEDQLTAAYERAKKRAEAFALCR